MIINHNLSAMNANRYLGLATRRADSSISQISSGERINHAADDAAGLAISEKMRSQIRGLNQASRNIQDGVSFIQTTEGYLEETTSILQRIRQLSVQAANGIYQESDRNQIQVEVSQLLSEVDRIASQAQFNGMMLLDGSFSGGEQALAGSNGLTIHMGANMDQNANISIGNMGVTSLGLSGLNIAGPDASGANAAIGVVDAALGVVNKQRADLGAYQNRLTEARNGVDVAAENIQSAESRIRDADMSKSIVEYTRNNILAQTTTAMLSQANMRPQMVLQLLGS